MSKYSNETKNGSEKGWYVKLWEFCKTKVAPWFVSVYNKKVLLCLVSALIINLLIELLGRRSIVGLFKHVFLDFHMFVYAVAVIAFTLFLSCLFKRRLFAYVVICALWIALGISNGTILTYRENPMVAIDFLIMRSSIGISTMYVNVFSMLLISLGIIAGIVLLVMIFKWCPKERRDLKTALITLISSGSVIAILATAFYFGNAVDSSALLPDVYKKCGYVYCFTYSLFDYGVDEPEVYDEDYMAMVKAEVDKVDDTRPDELPNVVFVQLESYMDMERINGIELSESPQPFFQQLKANYPSGYLKVNALGASTANVEYEVLTGNYIKDFGFDEYPYKTFLFETPVETIAYDLKTLGYETTALHNHDGGFYSRYVAYTNLGFDTFIPRETLTNIEKNPTGWCKDKMLLDEIKQTIEASESRDFVFTVTVQCHSKYPKERLEDCEYPISVGGFDDEGYINQLDYYASQVKEEDEFLKELLGYFEELDEKTIVVLYGDHLPTFINDSKQLVEGVNSDTDSEKYLSEYVIWSNYGAEEKAENKDLKSCELSSYVLDCAGIRTGTLLKLYHAELDEKTLSEYRQAIVYDSVEGKRYIYEGNDVIKTMDMQIGRIPLKISSYEIDDGTLFVNGQGFTDYVDIYINNQLYTSTVIDSETVKVDEEVTLENNDSIVAKMNTFDRLILCESNSLKVEGLQNSVVVNDGISGIHKTIVIIITVLSVCAVLTVAFVIYRKKVKSNKQ